MKLNKIIISLLAVLLFGACEVEFDFQDEINDSFNYARVNRDASNSELMSIITESGDTITWYGDKNQNGTALNIKTIEQTTIDGIKNFIDFDESGRLISITNNIGVIIEFEWQSSTTAVITANSQKDNYFISTFVDFSNKDNTQNKEKTLNNSNRLKEQLKLDILNNRQYSDLILKEKEIYNTQEDFPKSQEVWLYISRCNSGYDAKNYLILKNATNGITIGKLVNYVNYSNVSKGNYSYQLPLCSYPSSATNQQLCASIDAILRNIENTMSAILVDSAPIIYAINYAAFITGYGTVPAVITDAIVLALNAINCGISIFNSYGGVAGMMQRINSEWYYREYIISDLNIIPVAFTKTTTVMGEEYRANPTMNVIDVYLDIPGEPIINSFILNPSHPQEGQGYTATVDYNCIPENSTITLSIEGTDGYSDSVTSNISGSGSAVLYVPGAESGVYDLCTVIINMPFGETITMNASLIFGY